MHRFVENHWFALSELVWVMAAGVTWALVPQLGWRLLPVALLPWLLRLAGGQFPFKRTRFDFLILVFLLTAVVGAWAAYDREAALAKFYLLVAGMLLFYALASQPKDNVWLVAGLFAAFGAGVAIFFLLTYDWQTDPAKINLIQQAAVWWMGRRPNFLAGTIHHNTAGGILAITAPFLIALLSYASRGRMILLTVWVFMAGTLLIIGLLFSTSRGAWIGLTAGLGVWVLWLLSGKLAGRFQWKQSALFGVGIMVSCILVFGLFALYPGGVIDLAGELPRPDSAVTRLDLAQNGLKLLGDFSFTGGGLGAFAGLYSHYIRAIPLFYFDYSHNLLLDIALEQGILGLLAFGLIYLGIIWFGIWSLLTTATSPLILASLSTLVVIFVHGLVDNVIYYQWSALLLFMVPGFMLSLMQPVGGKHTYNEGKQHQQQELTQSDRSAWLNLRITTTVATIAAAVMILVVGFTYRHSWLASWYSNLGAVQMAKIELADFPSGQWDDGGRAVLLEPAQGYFLRALDYDPDNRTANHRLGLIAMQQRDFSTATSYLVSAHQLDSDHRGISKNLGYACAWSGDFDQATPLLAQIPEARQELSTYTWWWGTRGREDLAENADRMLVILDSQSY